MQFDTIPNLPEINPSHYDEEDENLVVKNLLKSKRKLILYENEDGNMSTYFKNLDHIFFSEFLPAFSPHVEKRKKLFDFLKLCLEGVRLVSKRKMQSFKTALKIESYIKSKNV